MKRQAQGEELWEWEYINEHLVPLCRLFRIGACWLFIVAKENRLRASGAAAAERTAGGYLATRHRSNIRLHNSQPASHAQRLHNT